jgi:hypothetical protein
MRDRKEVLKRQERSEENRIKSTRSMSHLWVLARELRDLLGVANHVEVRRAVQPTSKKHDPTRNSVSSKSLQNLLLKMLLCVVSEVLRDSVPFADGLNLRGFGRAVASARSTKLSTWRTRPTLATK